MDRKTLITVGVIIVVVALGGYAISTMLTPSEPAMNAPTTNAPTSTTPTPPSPTITRGEYTCLPPKDTTGPNTLECALGLKADTGGYYALDTTDVGAAGLIDLQTGMRIAVTGAIEEDVLGTALEKYDILGVIRVTGMVRI